MTTTTATLPALPLQPPSSKVGSNPATSVLEVEMRQVPVFSLRVTDNRLAPLFPHFPILLRPIRAAYLPPTNRGAWRVSPKSDLLVEARMPEVLGDVPLAVWSLDEKAVAELARANASSGALLLQLDGKKEATRRVLTPYWLDWQGWSGIARYIVASPAAQDKGLLRYLAYEIGQRVGDAPTGLLTARAYLLEALGEVEEAAAACQEEIALHLDAQGVPSAGALEALVLLGRLLNAHDEKVEARAAFSLALWVNPNQLRANIELLPFFDDEESVVASLVRLSRMPTRPASYQNLLAQSASKLSVNQGALEKRVEAHAKAAGTSLWRQRPGWLQDTSPTTWLHTLNL